MGDLFLFSSYLPIPFPSLHFLIFLPPFLSPSPHPSLFSLFLPFTLPPSCPNLPPFLPFAYPPSLLSALCSLFIARGEIFHWRTSRCRGRKSRNSRLFFLQRCSGLRWWKKSDVRREEKMYVTLSYNFLRQLMMMSLSTLYFDESFRTLIFHFHHCFFIFSILIQCVWGMNIFHSLFEE